MLRRLERRAADQSGVVLALVAIMMVSFLGMVALAIDLGSYWQAQRQAQAAADAGALAGAQDLAAVPGSAGADATTYAQTNVPGATVNADTASTTNVITVKVSSPTPVFFGRFLNLFSQNVSARAVAGRTAGTSCSSPVAGSSACDAIFAKDSTCTDTGISITGGGVDLTGGIQSNGSASTVGMGNNGVLSGPLLVGNTSGCAWNGNTGGASAATHAPAAWWPIDYSLDFPACAGAACTGPSSTPSYCTQAWTSATAWAVSPASGNIYCDVGTGTAGNPSTWTGQINVSVGSGTMKATYVAGSVSLSSSAGAISQPCGYAASGYLSSGCTAAVPKPATTNYPIIYAASSSSTAITVAGGNGTIDGDLFALNGTVNFGGGQTSSLGFIEGNKVVVSGGGLSGDGPTTSTPATSFGDVALLQ
jgi:Flp pilus assembly protein TadG